MSGTKHILITVLFIVFTTNITIASDWRENAKAIDISGGENHTLVLTANKWPWACGPNSWYQLGIGDTTQSQKILIRVHGGIVSMPRLQDINDLDAGWKHSLALEYYEPNDPNHNGYVWSWGDNEQGELGVGEGKPHSDIPVRVLRGAQVPADPNDPNLARIVDISAGRSGEHSLAVDANGYAYAWGYNRYGQCGNEESGYGERELTPVYVHQGQQLDDPNDSTDRLKHIMAVSAAQTHSMALEAIDPWDPNWDGEVYTFGSNWWPIDGGSYASGYGKLGDGTDVQYSDTPVRVKRGEQDYNEPGQVYLKHIVAISTGWDHSMALEKYEEYDSYLKWLDPNGYTWPDPNHRGRVYTWGNNGQGWGDGLKKREFEGYFLDLGEGNLV